MITHLIYHDGNPIKYVRMAGKIKEIVNKYTISSGKFGTCFNGYGYEEWHYEYEISDEGISLLQEILNKPKKVRKRKTDEEIKIAWSKRLAKLGEISIEEAMKIADDKLNYKE